MITKECFLQPLVDYYQLNHPINWEKVFQKQSPVEVEIGFGMGEVLVCSAQDYPDRNYIGIEQKWERIYKTLKRIYLTKQSARKGDNPEEILHNIGLLRVDAWAAFERLFTPLSLDRIFCLFPCPWPKKSHIKYRLFSKGFLRLLNNRLKKEGEVQLVTDFYPYYEWILSDIQGTGFLASQKKVKPRYATKFEKKWIQEGQKEFFEIKLTKKRHIKEIVKEDVVLKSYKVKDFNPQRFQLPNETGPISVIFKDMLYDKEQNTALVHVVVSEEHLTQHLRVSIVKRNNSWLITRAEGQIFFPTRGIARALELVHQAAKASAQGG